MESSTPTEMLKLSDAAARLGVSRATIYRWVAERRIPTVKLGPRCTRVPRAALDAWIAAQAERAVDNLSGRH